MSEEYAEMLRIQRIRQAEVAEWRAAQTHADEVRELEMASIDRVSGAKALPVLPLSEPIGDEDDAAEVSVPVVEVKIPKKPKPVS